MAEARARWKNDQIRLDPAKLIFIDETGASTKMARLYGRAKRGRRVIGRIPWGHWKTVTFVAALRLDGLNAPFVIDCAMNGTIFIEYLRQCLVPTLRPGDIVIIDNLSAHKRDEVRQIIEAAGAELRLPAALQPRSQSDRTGLREAQGSPAQSKRTHRARVVRPDRKPDRLLPAKRMSQLLQKIRICSNLIGFCSRAFSTRNEPGFRHGRACPVHVKYRPSFN